MLKVDKYGCLVPGCQGKGDSTSTTDFLTQEDIKLYPNPVTENLYVYQYKEGRTKYTISDLSGRRINSWTGSNGGHTFIVDVGNYIPGIYILTAKSKERSFSKKFVVARE